MVSNIPYYESEEELAETTVLVKKRKQKRDRQWRMEKYIQVRKKQ